MDALPILRRMPPTTATGLTTNPYLHIEGERIYNPLTDRALVAGEPQFVALRRFIDSGVADETLVRDGWVVAEGEDLSRRHLLKILSLEPMTTCNQKCYFCPVSAAARDDETVHASRRSRRYNLFRSELPCADGSSFLRASGAVCTSSL